MAPNQMTPASRLDYPITYPSLRAIFQYLPFVVRRDLVKKVKPLRGPNKGIPRYLTNFDIMVPPPFNQILVRFYEHEYWFDDVNFGIEGYVESPVIRERLEKCFAHYHLGSKETYVERMKIMTKLWSGWKCAARIGYLKLRFSDFALDADTLKPFCFSESIRKFDLYANAAIGTEWARTLSEINADHVELTVHSMPWLGDFRGLFPFRVFQFTCFNCDGRSAVDMGLKLKHEPYDIKSTFYLRYAAGTWENLKKALKPEIETESVFCTPVLNPKHELLVKRRPHLLADFYFEIEMEIVERGTTILELAGDSGSYQRAVQILKTVRRFLGSSALKMTILAIVVLVAFSSIVLYLFINFW